MCWGLCGDADAVAAMGSGRSGLGLKGGASDVAEGDVVGHFHRDSSCKGADLLMNVHEEGFRAPASHFLDGFGVYTIEIHCHGTPSSQGVGADVISGVAQVVETNDICCVFEC